MAYTYLQLKGRVMDIPHRPKNQDDTEIKALINESYFALVAELGCFQKSFGPVTLTVNDGDYDVITEWSLPDFAAMRSLNYTAANGLYIKRPLDITSPDELLALRQSNPVATSPSVVYAMPDWRSVMLQPLPAVGDTVSGLYAAYPAAMSAEGDTPLRLPPDMHHLIVAHCAAIAMEQMDITLANQMMGAFYAGELRRAKSSLQQRKGSRAFTPGAHRGVPLLPGEYWSHP